LTGFDGKLSKYLAAVTGTGLSGASVETRIRDAAGGRSWMPYPIRHVASVPDAFAAAARFALGEKKSVTARVGVWLNDDDTGGETKTDINEETVRVLERALKVCRFVGTVDFLEISGDFERVLTRPVGSDMDMMVIDLQRGTVSIPTAKATSGPAWQGPIFGFEKAANQAPAVSAFLGRARHAVSLAKEEAILTFRDAAEERIMSFNEALGGRDLSGYRLKSATSLVSRLQAGLGDTLLGLSEAAQITALDWATQVQETTRTPELRRQLTQQRGEIPKKPRPHLVR